MDWTAIGAFLSGAGSVAGAVFVIRAVRKRADEECEKRFAALREGLRIGRDVE